MTNSLRMSSCNNKGISSLLKKSKGKSIVTKCLNSRALKNKNNLLMITTTMIKMKITITTMITMKITITTMITMKITTTTMITMKITTTTMIISTHYHYNLSLPNNNSSSTTYNNRNCP